MNVLVILGTDRKGARSRLVANWVRSQLESYSFVDSVNFADPENIKLSYSEKDSNYLEMLEKSDSVVIVSPEYNHSFPGTLKTLLDMDLERYKGKPVGIIGVSNGGFGGARMISSILPTLRRLGLKTGMIDLNVMNVNDFIIEEKFEASEFHVEKLKQMIDEVRNNL